MDEGLFKKLLAFHSAHQNAKQSEHVEGGYIEVPGTTQPGSDLIELPEDLRGRNTRIPEETPGRVEPDQIAANVCLWD